jgi:EamA domain-containing membrane protein RarD
MLPSTRRRGGFAVRVGIYFAAFVVFFISMSGVATVGFESMLRYHFCTHALIVLAILHFLREVRRPPLLVRRVAMAAIALLSAAGFGVQGWYVWNFTRGNWVA